jgi:hypothetical protein
MSSNEAIQRPASPLLRQKRIQMNLASVSDRAPRQSGSWRQGIGCAVG